MRTHYMNGEEIYLTRCGCDCCTPIAHNNAECLHESGCTAEWKDKSKPCWLCGFDFYPTARNQSYCEDCMNDTSEADDND